MRVLATLLALLAITGAAVAHDHPATVLEALEANKNKGLGILLEAALAADPLFAKLATDKSLVATVFAPTDDAFVALLKALKITKKQLFANKDLLNKVLSYHFVAGAAVKAGDLKPTQAVQTLLKGSAGKLHIRKGPNGAVRLITSSQPKRGVSKVITADVPAGHVIIHVVDTVLVPKL